MFTFSSQDHGRLSIVHVSKHSLFRLKITVGCRLCTCPSIHYFVSRSRSVVDCARVQIFTFLLTKTLSRSRSVVWCVVWCVVFCVYMWCCVWCVCGVCALFCCGGACVVCVVKLGTLSLLLSLIPLIFPFRFPFLFLSSFSCSSSLALSLTLALALVISLFLLSLLFSPPNTMERNRSTNTAANIEAFECDLAQGKCTAVGSLPPPLPSLLLFSLPSSKKKKRELLILGIFPARNLFLLQF